PLLYFPLFPYTTLFRSQSIDFEFPGRKIDLGRAVRIEHRPFLGARLALWNSVWAAGVRTDDDLRIVNLFSRARITCLVVRILKRSEERRVGKEGRCRYV